MNSNTSKTWVHDASLLSRTPMADDMVSPEAQIPLNPASSTIFAERPLCASIMNSDCEELIIARS